jgi:hypothetical protein
MNGTSRAIAHLAVQLHSQARRGRDPLNEPSGDIGRVSLPNSMQGRTGWEQILFSLKSPSGSSRGIS